MEIKHVAVFVDARKCCIEDLPTKVYVKEKATLKVILKDTKGNPICKGASIFTVEVTSATNNDIPLSAMELENGKYLVLFTPVASGDHVVSIQINGMHISRSPTKIPCSSTITETLVGYKEYTGIKYDSLAVGQAEHNVNYKKR